MFKFIDPVFYFDIISGLIALFIELLPGGSVTKYLAGAGITATAVISVVLFFEVFVGKTLRQTKEWLAVLILAVAIGVLWPVVLAAIFFVLMIFLPSLAGAIFVFGVGISLYLPFWLFMLPFSPSAGLPKSYG